MSKERQLDKKSSKDEANPLANEAEVFFRTAPDDREERLAFQAANRKVLDRKS